MIRNYDSNKATIGVGTSPVRRQAVKQEGTLSVEVIRDDARFFALRERWVSVLAESSASVYQTHEWLWLWWKYFRTPDCTLFVLAVWQGKRILALAPLYIHSQRLMGFRICRRLKLMGDSVPTGKQRGFYAENGPSDYLDIVVAQEDAIPAMVQSILHHRRLYDEIDFTNIPEHSLLRTNVLPALEASGCEPVKRQAQPCPYLDTPDSLDAYLQRLPTSTRRKFNHARKKFFHERGYTIEHVQHPKDIVSGFRDLAALHQRRWNRAGYIGLFRDSRYEHFIAEVIQVFQERGWLWFKSLMMGGTRFAARLGFRFNGKYYDYLSGFDDDAPFAKARPGYALLLSFLEDAIAERCRRIDFLRGAEPYKFELTDTVAHNWVFRAITPEYHTTLSYKLSRILFKVEDLLHRAKREWLILRIYFHEHGIVKFLPEYVHAFVGRVVEKIKKRNSQATKDENQRFGTEILKSGAARPPQQSAGLQTLIDDGKRKPSNVRAE